MRHTFPKTERLSGKTKIQSLFQKGRADLYSFYLFPFRVIYQYAPPRPETSPAPLSDDTDSERLAVAAEPIETLPAVLINVSKRQFKRAVDRNLLRRRVREAYRLHKQRLGHANTPPTELAFLYIAKTKLSFEDIERGMRRALQKVDVKHVDPPR
ncbi:ribonuclease P protein component [Rudanella paleaurantiibacter]|uniref:Ribonuclease P protein component n=1 Tax=Rudanella paleaurantiibacter TaxID=2614655 RepID=A0A7J5U4Q9_9BACT|nr:ribonuclease P protein component [Rudanella paleaurantiibacter]KAB7732683.1 ribonuclease P protein component [Rudanella paleaurantiibacter]